MRAGPPARLGHTRTLPSPLPAEGDPDSRGGGAWERRVGDTLRTTQRAEDRGLHQETHPRVGTDLLQNCSCIEFFPPSSFLSHGPHFILLWVLDQGRATSALLPGASCRSFQPEVTVAAHRPVQHETCPAVPSEPLGLLIPWFSLFRITWGDFLTFNSCSPGHPGDAGGKERACQCRRH